MATFQSQVESIVGNVSYVGSVLKLGYITQFIQDGIQDVTQRTVRLNVEDSFKFQRTSAVQVTQGFNPGGSTILSVMRESGTSGDYRVCRQVGLELQSRVTDINSIHYASKFNPVYVVQESGRVNVYPAPDDQNGEKYIVNYINSSPVDALGGPLTYADSNIGFFPSEKIYLVSMYAAIKMLDLEYSYAQGNLPITVAGMVLEPITLPTAPSAATISVNAVASFGTAPVYTKPVLNLTESPSLGSLSITATAPTAPAILGDTLNFDFVAPVYNAPSSAPNFGDADTWINTEEDSEMSNARVSVIQSEIQKYQSDIQNETQNFNKLNTEYQTKFQEAVQKANNIGTHSNQLIQTYSNDLQNYVNQVNKEVQEYQATESQKFSKYQIDRSTEVQKYQADIQNALNDFNEEATAYQANVQAKLQDSTQADAKQQRDIQNFSADVGNYQAKVNAEIQRVSTINQGRISDYNAKIQQYANEVSKAKLDAELHLQKSVKLQKQYDEAFLITAPRQRGGDDGR